jgi:hypothetical protein
MRWAGHVARVGAKELHTGFWLGNMMGKPAWKTDVKIILKWGFKTLDVEAWT